MSQQEHRRLRPSTTTDSNEGNAWDEVRIASVSRPAHGAPLSSSVDWLDGEVRELGDDRSAHRSDR